MTTSDSPLSPAFELSEAARAALNVQYGLILVSGEAGSGKTTTLNLFRDAFNKKLGDRAAMSLDFKGNGFGKDFLHFSFPAFGPELYEGATRKEQVNQWGNGIFRTLTIPNPWVVVIDDMPEDFFNTAINMALTGSIVVASMNAASAEDALNKYSKVIDPAGGRGNYLLKMATEASIWQEMSQDPETGQPVMKSYGIDVSKDQSHQYF